MRPFAEAVFYKTQVNWPTGKQLVRQIRALVLIKSCYKTMRNDGLFKFAHTRKVIHIYPNGNKLNFQYCLVV